MESNLMKVNSELNLFIGVLTIFFKENTQG